MLHPKELVRHELIGLEVEVAESTNTDAVGIRGRVINETRNMLFVEVTSGKHKGKEKGFAKEQCTFLFTLPAGGKVRIEGRLLVSRPEDRIKKKFRKW